MWHTDSRRSQVWKYRRKKKTKTSTNTTNTTLISTKIHASRRKLFCWVHVAPSRQSSYQAKPELQICNTSIILKPSMIFSAILPVSLLSVFLNMVHWTTSLVWGRHFLNSLKFSKFTKVQTLVGCCYHKLEDIIYWDIFSHIFLPGKGFITFHQSAVKSKVEQFSYSLFIFSNTPWN